MIKSNILKNKTWSNAKLTDRKEEIIYKENPELIVFSTFYLDRIFA